MDKISIICKRPITDNLEYNLGPYFNRWLMRQFPADSIDRLNATTIKPYTIRVRNIGNKIHFTITLLTDEVSKLISSVLLNSRFEEVVLDMDPQRCFPILNKQIQYLTEQNLLDTYFGVYELSPYFTLHFSSATTFLAQQEYVFFPNVQLLFQNLITQYTHLFGGINQLIGETLEEICEYTKITGYRISSTYYKIGDHSFLGFIGEVRLNCSGNQSLRRYIAMLLLLAEYTGVGIQTQMGMGVVSVDYGLL